MATLDPLYRLTVSQNDLLTNVAAMTMIAVGLVSAEAVADGKGGAPDPLYPAFTLASMVLFPAGWALFLYLGHERYGTQATMVGAMIPVVAFAAQAVFNRQIDTAVAASSEDARGRYARGVNSAVAAGERRRSGKMMAVAAWMPFMAVWFAYLTLKDDGENSYLNLIGMMLLGGGMMSYFFTRRYSWSWMFGRGPGATDKRESHFSIGVVLVGMGWVLLALGNTTPGREQTGTHKSLF